MSVARRGRARQRVIDLSGGGGGGPAPSGSVEWGPRFGKTEDETFTGEAASDLSAVDLTGQVDGSTTVTMDQVDLTGNVATTSAIDLYTVDLDGQVDPTAAFTMDSVDLIGNLATTAATDLADVAPSGTVGTSTTQTGTAEGTPFWLGKTTLEQSSSSVTRTFPTPPGVQEGDLLVAHFACSATTNRPDFTLGGPSGWTQLSRQSPVTTTILMDQETWWKLAGASEPAEYTWTSLANTTKFLGSIHHLRGVDQTTPIDGTAERFSPASDLDTTPNQANITTTVDNCLVISFLWHDHTTSANTALHSPASNQVELDDGNGGAAVGQNYGRHAQSRTYSTAGPTDGVGHGCQQTVGADAVMVRVAIRPGPLTLGSSSNWQLARTRWTGINLTVNEANNSEALAVSTDDLRFYLGDDTKSVHQWVMTDPFQLQTATYDNSFTAGTELTGNIQGIDFTPDGTKMFLGATQYVTRYTLSTPWDVTTASYDGNGVRADLDGVPSYTTSLTDVQFKDDGTKMFVLDFNGDRIIEFSLGTAWDPSSYTFTTTFSYSNTGSMRFGDSGRSVYITWFPSAGTNICRQSDLTTAWDISTIVAPTFGGVDGVDHHYDDIFGAVFNSTGQRLIYMDEAVNRVWLDGVT